MQKVFNIISNGALLLFAPFFLATISSAQIVNAIDATIPHSFVVSSKTLPPGKYTFRMSQGSSGSVMTVTNADGKNSDEFLVQQAQASSTPAHTELIFNRYGKQAAVKPSSGAPNCASAA